MNLQLSSFEAPAGHFAAPPDLAHVAPFELGTLKVDPASRRLTGPLGESSVIEPLVMQVLVALAQSVGETLSRDDLVTRCWGRRIVGDDAVNRVISRLRRNLAGVGAATVQVRTIAKVGYRLEIVTVPADGMAEIAARNDGSPRSRWLSRRSVASAALSLAGLAAVTGFVLIPAPAPAIAMSIQPSEGEKDPAAADFVSDLTGAVANLTGSMTRLSFVEPGTPATADLILKVTYSGDAPRRTAQTRLVDTSNGAVIWSRGFEDSGQSADILRNRVAQAVASVVRCGLDRSAGDLGDAVSRRLYFAACDSVSNRDWPAALKSAQQIAALRPNSAASWACMAITIALGGQESPYGRAAASAHAMQYARKALEIDPRSGLAHQALAMALQMQGRDGLAQLEAGVRSDPEHGWLLALYASALFDSGFPAASVQPVLRATTLEPGDLEMSKAAFRILLGSGNLAQARRLAVHMERMWPDDLGVRHAVDDVLFYDADPAAALVRFEASGGHRDADSEILHSELQWRARPSGFDWVKFDRLAERLYDSDGQVAWRLALAAARMGDKTRGMTWLHRSHSLPGKEQWSMLFAPEAAVLRRDPRFFEKMEEVGMVDIWRGRDRWPEFCADEQLTYDCQSESARLARAERTRQLVTRRPTV